MGLPLFITPVEPVVESKVRDKTRVSRVAGHHHRSARPAPVLQRRRSLVGLSHREVDARYRQLEAEAARIAENGYFAPPGPVEGQTNYPAWQPPQNLGIYTRDFDRPILDTESLRPTINSTGEVPTVSLRRVRALRERLERQHVRSRASRRHAAPTPPYQESDHRSLRPTPPAANSFTPEISPGPTAIAPTSSNTFTTAARLDSGVPPRPQTLADYQMTMMQRNRDEGAAALNRSAEDWRRSRNYLRRAHIERQPHLDGLGDRTRSMSPDGTWDTLLTSITPDPQPPSANSSFASDSAAAATISITQSPRSPDTSNDEIDAIHDAILHDCDMSDGASTGIEQDEDDIFELLEFDGRDDRRYLANAASSATPSREQLRGMHQIILGLVEREDISDEWWASVGLSRNL